MFRRLKRRHPRRLLGVMLASLLAVLSVAAVGSSSHLTTASAKPPVARTVASAKKAPVIKTHHTYGKTISVKGVGTAFFGVQAGKNKHGVVVAGWCVNWSKKDGWYVGIVTKKSLTGASKDDLRRINRILEVYKLSRYPASQRDKVAAAEGIAIVKLIHDPRGVHFVKLAEKVGKINASLQKSVSSMLKTSKNRPGRSFKIRLDKQHPTGTVTLQAGGKAVPGNPRPALSIKGGKILSYGKPSSTGVTSFKYQVTSAEATISAHVSVPDYNRVVATKPAIGHQQLVIRPATKTLRATASKAYVGGHVSVSNACEPGCEGKAPIKVTACASVFNGTMHVVEGPLAFDVRPGTCRTVTSNPKHLIADGTHLKGHTCLLARGKCVKGTIRTLKSFEVVCPPWAEVTVVTHIKCGCAETQSIAFAAPNSVRYYIGIVRVNGKIVASKALTNGKTLHVASVSLPHGSSVEYDFAAFRDPAHKQLLREERLAYQPIP